MPLALLLLAVACFAGKGSVEFYKGDNPPPVTMTLTATPVSPTAITVRWTVPSTPPSRYDLYVNGAYYGSSSAAWAPLTGLAPGTNYCFVAYAIYYLSSYSGRSNEACARTPADLPPSTPTGVSATALSTVRIDLAWTAATDDWGPPGYRISRNGVTLGTTTDSTYSDVSANPGTTYCYTVTAVDSGGNTSPPSPSVCATTLADTEPPSSPTGLYATASDTTVTLYWTASSDNGAVASYRLYRNGALVQTAPAVPGVTYIQVTDPNLAAYTQYCYEIVAVDRANNTSGPSNRACITTSWQRSVLLAAPTINDYVGERHALALDASGKMHVAYSFQSWDPALRAYTPPELRLADNATGPWITTQVAASFEMMYRPSIATDANARPHVSFMDRINHLPQYAQPTAPWQIERIAPESTIGVSLALDPSGLPHVAYSGSQFRYASRASGSWTLAGLAGVARSSSFALGFDPSGHAQVVFADTSTKSLRYATDAGGSWSTMMIEPTQSTGWDSTALALDATGFAHVSYTDGAGSQLKYATNRTGVWVSEIIDSNATSSTKSSIALDGSGAAHISYIDFSNLRLKYATNLGGTWRSYDLDFVGYGTYSLGDTSIAIDRGGRIHILYFGGSQLHYATRP